MTKLFGHLKPVEITLPVRYALLRPHMRRQVREQYITNQAGRCYHCDEPLNGEPPHRITRLTVHEELFPKGFFDHPVHLHHDHNTGLTLGAVHAYCNAVLWQYNQE